MQQFFEAFKPPNPQGNMNAVPKRRVLSSKTRIALISPVDGEEIDIGEIDSFNQSSDMTVVKQWKPFGFKTNETILEPNGWNLTFTAGKVDWKLAYLYYCAEKYTEGTDEVNRPVGPTEALYNNPVFIIKRTVYHYGGKIEAYIYHDVALLGFTEEDNGNNEVINQTLRAYSPRREQDPNFSVNTIEDKINNKTKDIVAWMLRNR